MYTRSGRQRGAYRVRRPALGWEGGAMGRLGDCVILERGHRLHLLVWEEEEVAALGRVE